MLLNSSVWLMAAVHLGAPLSAGPFPGDSLPRRSLASPAATGTHLGEGAPEIYDGSSRELEVPASPLGPARVELDGRLDDAAWAEAAVLGGFTQYEPSEGIPATQETRVRVLVTSEAILFGVEAHDSEPGGVRATLSRRDGFGRSDDYVRFVLDTFHDRRRAFVFQVNPLGVQGDGLWVEGKGGFGDPIDWNPDFLWESAGRVGEDGYTVEVKIPLKTLRFPDVPEQSWGLQVMRRIQRNGYQESWAPITGEVANQLSQAGSLMGLKDLKPGRFLELNPVFTATRQGSWDDASAALSHSAPQGEFGFNAAYGLTSNLTLDATFNPDFSQVEADAGQIAVNERFALFFPEKRAFFLEGTDIFNMPRQLLYTRSVANPVGAAKLSGKVGSFNVAYIGAVDEVGGGEEHPVVNLLRVKRDVGGHSSVGLAYTDRTLAGESFNRVLGADARLVLGQRYTLDLMAAGSADRPPGAETRWGSLLLARLERSSRGFSFNASFEDADEDFRARSGFIRRVGITQMEGRAGYTWRGAPGAFLESWGPSLELKGTWDRQDFWRGSGPLESSLQVSVRTFLRGNVGAFLTYSREAYDFGPESYEGLFVGAPGGGDGELTPFRPSPRLFGGLDAVRLRAWLSRWERARVMLSLGWSETPIFTLGVPADVGESWSTDANLTLYPTGSLSLETGVRHVTLLRKRDGSRYSSATIPRLQARYQFSRALYLRAIGEYSSQSRGDVLDPVSGAPVESCGEACAPRAGSDAHDFRLEGLLGYEPSPGSVLYLGYTRQMRDTGAFSFRDVTARADGLFVKVSYRVRM